MSSAGERSKLSEQRIRLLSVLYPYVLPSTFIYEALLHYTKVGTAIFAKN